MMQFIDVLNSNPWLRFLLNATMKSLVIFAVAGVLAFLLRSKSAALRGLVWNMAILGCLMVSVLFLTLTPYEIGVLPGKPVGFETNVSVEDNQLAVTPVPMAPRPLPTTAASLTHATAAPIQPEPATGESSAPQLNGSRTTFVSFHWTDWMALVWARRPDCFCSPVWLLAWVPFGTSPPAATISAVQYRACDSVGSDRLESKKATQSPCRWFGGFSTQRFCCPLMRATGKRNGYALFCSTNWRTSSGMTGSHS